MEPLISVIVPIYNTEEYLEKCVNSILQSSFVDYEVLLIDDGSTDRSGDIIDEFAQKDDRIRLFHNSNRGPAATRHFGVKHAKGETILFVDSDDRVDAHLLEVLWRNKLDSNADVVVCQYYDVYENGRKIITTNIGKDIWDIDNKEEIIHLLHGTRQILGGPYCKLFTRESLLNINYYEDVTIGEDYAMVLEVMQKSKKIRLIPDTLYYRNMHRGNISHSGYTERHKNALGHYQAIRKKLLEEYPKLSNDILEYHLEYEMAVITAMCRNKNYDWNVIKKLRMDLKNNILLICKSKAIPVANRFSAVLIVFNPKLFIILFRGLHIITGR